jgi:hypothetical protein
MASRWRDCLTADKTLSVAAARIMDIGLLAAAAANVVYRCGRF